MLNGSLNTNCGHEILTQRGFVDSCIEGGAGGGQTEREHDDVLHPPRLQPQPAAE